MSKFITNKSCNMCHGIELGLVEMNVGDTKLHLCYNCMTKFAFDVMEFASHNLLSEFEANGYSINKTNEGEFVMKPLQQNSDFCPRGNMKNIDCGSIRTVRVHKEQFDAIEKKADTIIITCIEDDRCLSFNKNQSCNIEIPDVDTIYVLSGTIAGKTCKPRISKDIKKIFDMMFTEYNDVCMKAGTLLKSYTEIDGTLVAHFGGCKHTWNIDAVHLIDN